jgi:acyl carrier protein
MSERSAVIVDWIRKRCLKNDPDRVVTTDLDLLESGILDSVRIAQMTDFLESQFDMEIDLDELFPENFSSIDRILAMLDRSA